MFKMVAQIFEVITQAVTSFVGSITAGVNGLIPLVYTAGEGSNPGSFTFVGTMLLIAIGVAVVYWCFRLIRGLTAGLAR